jgi:hypothetical protein
MPHSGKCHRSSRKENERAPEGYREEKNQALLTNPFLFVPIVFAIQWGWAAGRNTHEIKHKIPFLSHGLLSPGLAPISESDPVTM